MTFGSQREDKSAAETSALQQEAYRYALQYDTGKLAVFWKKLKYEYPEQIPHILENLALGFAQSGNLPDAEKILRYARKKYPDEVKKIKNAIKEGNEIKNGEKPAPSSAEVTIPTDTITIHLPQQNEADITYGQLEAILNRYKIIWSLSPEIQNLCVYRHTLY